MDRSSAYYRQVQLLIRLFPTVGREAYFALKGGTAINLFVRDMPRLSVDLDLVFADHGMPRDQALASIGKTLQQSAERLAARGFGTRLLTAPDASETKLLVRRGSIEVKIEVNFVMRGTVHPVRTAALLTRARDVLLSDLEIPVVSLIAAYLSSFNTGIEPSPACAVSRLFHALACLICSSSVSRSPGSIEK